MNILIVEDNFLNRRILQKFLSRLGECDIAVDGQEAIEAFRLAWQDGTPYELICLDIMMPNIDGTEALRQIRDIEREMSPDEGQRVKVIMTTALDDARSVVESYSEGAESYLVKPITREKLFNELYRLGLIEE